MSLLKSPPRWLLCIEWAMLFIAMPALICAHPTRANVPLVLWAATAYAALILQLTPDFSWQQSWCGSSFTRRDLLIVALRFLASSVGVLLLTILLQPGRLFGLPSQRPAFWLLIMFLYPLFSALPQEFLFRTFFFRRYAALFPPGWPLPLASAFCFSFAHIVFHNPVAPLLSFMCGLFLASSYLAHASLKRAALEHALYGDMLFSIGLGLYFFVHP